jgi:hypothetical protein
LQDVTIKSVSLSLSAVGNSDNIADEVCWEEYARVVHAFLAGFGKLKLLEEGNEHEIQIDFTKRKLLAVGHSMGANSLCATSLPLELNTIY